ncbi:MAG: DNA repair protein [Flavobacteriaceae bacterium]|nr:DNA repair protein [Flavobacteriaceae bacterium]|tara:strand:- start:2328 stop:2807 length:480 start_codon:yes stop_codon:yes gene_type:complete
MIVQTNKLHEVKISYVRPLYDSMPTVNSSDCAVGLIRASIDLESIDHKEYFWVLLLTQSNKVLGFSEVGKGDLNGVLVSTREILQLALLTNAKAIILSHNHPSGKLKPSKMDIDLTTKVSRLAALFSLCLLDHIIITSESYYSFADEGDILQPDNTLPF